MTLGQTALDYAYWSSRPGRGGCKALSCYFSRL